MTKDELLLSSNKVVDTLEVPEWGNTYLRRLSFGEVDRFNTYVNDKQNTQAFAWLVCCGVSDETGKRVFSDEDFPSVQNLPAEVVFPVGLKIASRVGVQFEKIEDVKKNSEPTT